MSVARLSRAIFFDLDGTLVDSRPGIAASMQHALAAAGVAAAPVELRTLIGPPLAQMVAQLLPTAAPGVQREVIRQFRLHYDSQGCLEADPFPGVDEGLRELSSLGFALFVLTNKRQGPAERIVSRHGWRQIMTGVDGSHESLSGRRAAGPGKPVRGEQLRARYGLAGVCVVGDGVDDFQTAEHLRGTFLLAGWGYGTTEVQRFAPHVVTLAAFGDLLPRLAKPEISRP
jgi:phosphoglycolate phosphatase